jgi:hypothetical protein
MKIVHITEGSSNARLDIHVDPDYTDRWSIALCEDGEANLLLNVEGAIMVITQLQRIVDLYRKKGLLNENQ